MREVAHERWKELQSVLFVVLMPAFFRYPETAGQSSILSKSEAGVYARAKGSKDTWKGVYDKPQYQKGWKVQL